MSDKTIRIGLCPGGRELMKRLLTHRFPFAELDKSFKLMSTKSDGIVKPLITF